MYVLQDFDFEMKMMNDLAIIEAGNAAADFGLIATT